MSIGESFAAELIQEASISRRFLERLPEDKLDWKPHAKSNTAGALAMHIAQSPGMVTSMAIPATFDASSVPGSMHQPDSLAQILSAHDEGTARAVENVRKLTSVDYHAMWTMVMGGKPVMSMPRAGVIRTIALSHTIQHRGQFGVYLRLLGAKVPWSYGPSGDELPPFLA